MAEYTDANRQPWQVEITIPAARRVKQLLGVNILQGTESLRQLSEDPLLFCDVLWLLCEEQAKAKQIDSEQFGAALAGDAFESAITAYMEALANFFPSRRREILQGVQQSNQALEEMLAGMTTERIPRLLQTMRAALSGSTSPDSPASSATNQPEPSESLSGQPNNAN